MDSSRIAEAGRAGCRSCRAFVSHDGRHGARRRYKVDMITAGALGGPLGCWGYASPPPDSQRPRPLHVPATGDSQRCQSHPARLPIRHINISASAALPAPYPSRRRQTRPLVSWPVTTCNTCNTCYTCYTCTSFSLASALLEPNLPRIGRRTSPPSTTVRHFSWLPRPIESSIYYSSSPATPVCVLVTLSLLTNLQ
ncbi:hypothetical protein T440DRAFT_317718 [Plenodomus tracheiphilus IPT5]|uniref:Uncharacterized protein n=1 Tax=Plenodomus tracheiphilus IPT5 TaxID=1408161 RepID=A0A6A7BCB0_9PLEO|nr:hypothetical protein T440DRAFT_317718 [Plenodomus tracheiphilus IPT5]